jgi:hypothetical protein
MKKRISMKSIIILVVGIVIGYSISDAINSTIEVVNSVLSSEYNPFLKG